MEDGTVCSLEQPLVHPAVEMAEVDRGSAEQRLDVVVAEVEGLFHHQVQAAYCEVVVAIVAAPVEQAEAIGHLLAGRSRCHRTGSLSTVPHVEKAVRMIAAVSPEIACHDLGRRTEVAVAVVLGHQEASCVAAVVDAQVGSLECHTVRGCTGCGSSWVTNSRPNGL